MIESLAPHSSPVVQTDDNLRLKCPCCGGGLNLKRKHLGLTGQCVHCRNPLTAVEENGVIRAVSDAPVTHHAVPATMESVASQVPPAAAPTPDAAIGNPIVAPEVVQGPPASAWGFPEFNIPATKSTSEAMVAESFIDSSPAASLGSSELAPPMPSREGDNLFAGRPELSPIEAPKAEKKPEPSPFGESSGFALSFSSPFLTEETSPGINPAWGTSVPQETHASISPFATGSANGGGFAESLFREKVVKEAAGQPVNTMSPQASPVATPVVTATPSQNGSNSTEAQKRECEERVILDGDGRPMRPMTKEEEEFFATSFMKYEHARSTPRWLKRLKRMFFRMLVFFCLLGVGGGALAYFTPKEKLIVWKEKVINWLEPGMAILDYLPEKLRPDWLPRTEFGIDAGVDENGQPKKKLNAFEGLEKLKGDVGNIRGAADEELKKLNEF